MPTRLGLLGLGVLLFLGFQAPAWAASNVDPDLKWYTASTMRFRVHYGEGLEPQALDVARFAEAAFVELAPYLDSDPRLPIDIVLWDNVDSPFGFAFPYPSNTIKLHLAPTGEDYLAGRFDSYLRQLVTHELTHVLQFEVHGVPSNVTNRILGKAAYPNLLLPLFLTEGLATLVENGHHRGGEHPLGDFGSRGDFAMMLRCAAIEGHLLSLDQVGTYGLSQWPAHRAPYLYGSHFYRFLIDRYGPLAPRQLFSRYAERPVVGLSWAASEATGGKDLYALWGEFSAFLAGSAERQRRAILHAPLTESRALTTSGMANRRPTWLPDGRLLYSRSDRHEPSALRLLDPRTGSDHAMLDHRAFGSFNLNKELVVDSPFGHGTVSPDGRYYYFSALHEVGRFNVFRDLFRLDLTNRHLEALTHGARYGDPARSPAGDRMVAVASGKGRQDLVLLDGAGRLVRYLTSEQGYPQFSSLSWSPDGTRVLASAWRGESRDLHLLDPQSGTLTPLWRDMATDVMPTWSPDGAWIVYSSDRTGVFNLYAHRVSDGRSFRLTNVLGGAFDPAISPDGRQVAFANYSARGYDLHLMPFVPENGIPVGDGQSMAFRIDGSLQPLTFSDPVPGPRPVPVATASYQALTTLRPHAWLPSAGFDDRGLRLGGSTWGADLLNQHQWGASVGLGLSSGRPGYALSYQNDQWLPRLSFKVADDSFPRDLSLPTSGRVQLWQRQQVAEASVRFPLDPNLGLTSMGDSLSGGLRWRAFDRYGMLSKGTFLSEDQWSSGLAAEVAQVASLPLEGQAQSAFVAWRHARTYRPTFGVSPEEGEAFGLSYEKGIGGASIDRWLAEARFFARMPWPHHALATRLVGGLNAGSGEGDFSLGGFASSQLQRTVGQEALGLLSQVPLRGFGTGSERGGRLLAASLEYRFPVLELDRGFFGEAPFLLQRLSAAVCYDLGTAQAGSGSIKQGLGLEARLQGELPLMPSELRLGLSQGFGASGALQPYVALGVSF